MPKVKKRRKQDKTPITKFQLEQAQKKIDAELQAIKDEASATGTRVFGCLCFLALHQVYGFGKDELMKVQDGIDTICQRIQEDEDYGWDNIYEELYPLGFEIEGVEFDENGKVKK